MAGCAPIPPGPEKTSPASTFPVTLRPFGQGWVGHCGTSVWERLHHQEGFAPSPPFFDLKDARKQCPGRFSGVQDTLLWSVTQKPGHPAPHCADAERSLDPIPVQLALPPHFSGILWRLPPPRHNVHEGQCLLRPRLPPCSTPLVLTDIFPLDSGEAQRCPQLFFALPSPGVVA